MRAVVSLCLSLAITLQCASHPGLADHRIAADHVTYLGSDWTASATIVPPRPAEGDYIENIDYDHGTTGPHFSSSTKVHITHPRVICSSSAQRGR